MRPLLIASLAAWSMVSCTSIPHFPSPAPETGVRHDPEVFVAGIPTLSATELARQQALARNGDGRAAFNVYSYYRTTANDPKQAREWLLRAGELGHAFSQYNLAQIYRHENNYPKAIYWARKARDNGYPHAQATLESLESEQP
ncbi:MAG: hypothetical protein LWW96_12400 [Acidovorax sp.]|uniref:tetratricopeptide repeat protein n=1 Tax=Acidovorax sp. TaxID=1872122 RepID=UPI0025C1BD8B|nr:hypothetical protein [Acidovorax sp.]MCE1192943.1 hypothetical protein [Acidovorax sp.]